MLALIASLSGCVSKKQIDAGCGIHPLKLSKNLNKILDDNIVLLRAKKKFNLSDYEFTIRYMLHNKRIVLMQEELC